MHLSQLIEELQILQEREGDLPVYVRSAAPGYVPVQSAASMMHNDYVNLQGLPPYYVVIE